MQFKKISILGSRAEDEALPVAVSPNRTESVTSEESCDRVGFADSMVSEIAPMS
jgi:hypothetical protein